MRDDECVELLQRILPVLKLRWAGFRRVRRQVCRNLARRMRDLGFASADDYWQYLTAHPDEWEVADSLCTVTISRFYRDKSVCGYLGRTVLPELGTRAVNACRTELLAWSAGCGSGEEPYTLALVWLFQVSHQLAGVKLKIVGTDIDDRLLRRAHEASYPSGCLKDLPNQWRIAAFDKAGAGYRLKARYREHVSFRQHDIRGEPINGPFDLVLCRNLAFTYFDHDLQLATARRLCDALREGGALVLGRHEVLPVDATGFATWSATHRVYRKLNAAIGES